MSGQRDDAGLCTTCENDATCTFPRTADRPVQQCEEFAVRHAPNATGWREKSEDTRRSPDPGPAAGLCANCDDQKECTFPNAGKGVVHCEEHR